MTSKSEICICEEMEASIQLYTAKTWQCPIHGQIMVDRRAILPDLKNVFFPIPHYNNPYNTGWPPDWYPTITWC